MIQRYRYLWLSPIPASCFAVEMISYTLPKAQRTRGLSSYFQSNFLKSCQELLHKSCSNIIFRILLDQEWTLNLNQDTIILSGRSMRQQEKVSSVGTCISSFHSSLRPTSTSTSTQLNTYVVKPADEFDGLCQLSTAHTASFTGNQVYWTRVS